MKSQVKLSEAKRYLVILAPLVKCLFKINTKTKIHMKTDSAVNQFPGIWDTREYMSIISQYMRHCSIIFIFDFGQMFAI